MNHDPIKSEIDGFDPLSENPTQSSSQDPNKAVVLNVLNSYTGFFDLFSELIQNGLDAIQLRYKSGESFKPSLWISIDMKERRVRVVDNGIGMDLEQFKFCFRPNVTYKRGAGLRGNKGVGATYLAYGFSLIHVQTKIEERTISAVLRQGRGWAEDNSGLIPRPTLEIKPFNEELLDYETRGTSFEILLGDSPGERPRDLGWIGARTAKQWLAVLRIKTPLGMVALDTPDYSPTVCLTVVAPDGTKTTTTTTSCDYYYPHEIPGKVKSLSEIKRASDSIKGDAHTKFKTLGSEFKRLDCMYEIYESSQILDGESDFYEALDPEERVLVEKHDVYVYGSFMSSAKQWSFFNDDVLELRKGQKIMHGGLQLACDGMVQGDPLIIPLTSTIGYQANAHVIVHFKNGHPDMGRKVFQPELKKLAEKLAVRMVTVFKRYLSHRRPEAGPPVISAGKALHQWKKYQENYRDANPLNLVFAGHPLALISEPQQEQDVIALFHELLGAGVLLGYRIFATSQSETYDSLYELSYPPGATARYDRVSTPLGVADRYIGETTEPKVMEYKYDFVGLIEDIEQEVKSQSHIDLVVCWKADESYRDRFYFKSLLSGDEGSERFHFGATHQAFVDSSPEPVFEVIILGDLLRFLANPAGEEARQKHFYKDA